MKKNNIPCNSTFIKSNSGVLPECIPFLKNKIIKLTDLLKVIKSTENKIGELRCVKNKAIMKKLNDKNKKTKIIVIKLY